MGAFDSANWRVRTASPPKPSNFRPVPGHIGWLPQVVDSDWMRENSSLVGVLGHYVLVTSVENDKVIVAPLTSFGGQPLDIKYANRRAWSRYIPLRTTPNSQPHPETKEILEVKIHGTALSQRDTTYINLAGLMELPIDFIRALSNGSTAFLTPDALNSVFAKLKILSSFTWGFNNEAAFRVMVAKLFRLKGSAPTTRQCRPSSSVRAAVSTTSWRVHAG